MQVPIKKENIIFQMLLLRVEDEIEDEAVRIIPKDSQHSLAIEWILIQKMNH